MTVGLGDEGGLARERGSGANAGRKHLLLTVLGRNPREACYELGGRQARARLAPLALLDLLPQAERPGCVVALCTSDAKKESWPLLKEKLDGFCDLRLVDVPTDHPQDDVDTFLVRVAEAIPRDPDVDLSVDVTHGYRHFSFLTYTAVLYLTALRGVRVRGAYYGLLLREGKPSPFLDLRPLLVLPRWFHALQVLGETGSARPIADLLREKSHKPFSRRMTQDLCAISQAHLSGLPVELGYYAQRFCKEQKKPLRRLLQADHRLPLARDLVQWLAESLGRFQFAVQVGGEGWKGAVPLSETELQRQAVLVDDLLSRESFAAALGLMNEWTVSWVVWRLRPENRWLDYHGVRRRAASLLGAIAAVARDPDLEPILNDEQRKLGVFWRVLCELRNAYHHHGMRTQVLVGKLEIDQKLKQVQSYWKKTMRGRPEFSLALGGFRGGRLLVSPIGRRPGVLFSAVQVLREEGEDDPIVCLVVCSRETEGLIGEALSHAGYDGPVERLVLDDPYGGRQEIERVVERARKILVGVDEVFVNVTGGTTIMGLAAECLADAARKLARPVRRFGLIDRRTPAEQESDPYRVGEAVWLDPEDADDDSD